MIDADATIVPDRHGRHGAGRDVGRLIQLMEAGFVDLVISTGANLYHDLHRAFEFPVRQGHFQVDDNELYEAGIARIYDVFITEDSLLATDAVIREALEKATRASPAHLHSAAPRLPRAISSWRTHRSRSVPGWRPPPGAASPSSRAPRATRRSG